MSTDSFADIGFAKLDLTRNKRTGMGETVYAPGKTKEQLLRILSEFKNKNIPVLCTKVTTEQAEFLTGNNFGGEFDFDPVSGILSSRWKMPEKLNGRIAVCTGGTADIPVAEEAVKTAEFFGCQVQKYFDVGVAGLHRILSQIESIRQADVIIAVAGMEGALASVLAGLVETPVIAVPTSVGYGAGFQGIAPLLSMLNSCAEGVSVVNIDNGFGAAVTACRMIRIMERKQAHHE